MRTTVVDSLREIVRDIVSEKLRKLVPAADRPFSLSLAEVVQEEVEEAFHPEISVTAAAQEEPALSYAETVGQASPAPHPYMAPPDMNLQRRSIPDARDRGRTFSQNSSRKRKRRVADVRQATGVLPVR